MAIVLYFLFVFNHEYLSHNLVLFNNRKVCHFRIYFISICIHSFIVFCGLDSIPFYFLSSAILYLNGDFEGGDFFFAKSVTDLTPDVRVKPRCGRLVGFSAGQENLHGVLGVTKGRRCAIALWFTLDSDHKEHTFDTAETLLTARSS